VKHAFCSRSRRRHTVPPPSEHSQNGNGLRKSGSESRSGASRRTGLSDGCDQGSAVHALGDCPLTEDTFYRIPLALFAKVSVSPLK
jgi:hypothetical protein